MTLAEYLYKERKARGYSQRDVAERSGISATEVSRLENGKRRKPSPDVLRAVADSLNLDYPALLRIAGYLETGKEPHAPPAAMITLEDGTAVDADAAIREMLQADPRWAAVAWRVSRKLTEEDREMLKRAAEVYLKYRGKDH